MRTRAVQWAMLLALLPVAALAEGDGRAQAPGGFSYSASIGETFSYDSNPLRVTNSPDALFGSTTSPRLVLRKKTERSYLEADTQLDQHLFNRHAYNSTDLHEKLLLTTENTRWVASVRGVADIDTTRTSELTNYALKLPKVTRTKLGATPELTYKSTPMDHYSIRATAAHITYDHDAYNDYDLYALSPSYTRKLDTFRDVRVTFNARRYKTTSGGALRSDSFGPMLGLTTKHSPRLTTRLSAGAEKSRKRGANAGSNANDWNYVFGVETHYRNARDQLTLAATRARQPFGNGTETLLTRVSLRERRTLNPTLAATLDAGYQTADYTTEPGINLDHGFDAGAGLAYHLTHDVDLTANYQFRNEQLTHTRGAIDQHVVLLGVRYHVSENEEP